MKIVAAQLLPFRLPLRRPLRTAHSLIEAREGVLIELRSESGARGYGEASPIAGFPGEELERSRDALCRAAARLIAGEPALPADAAIARAALACALLDLEARECGVPLAARLSSGAGLTPSPLNALNALAAVPVSALVPGPSLDDLASEAERAVASGFATLKLKVGVGTLEQDRARLRAVRASVAREVRIRIDANGAWGAAEALRAIDSLAEFDLEFVEQPVAGADLAGLAKVAVSSPVPIAADEACADHHSVQILIAKALCPVLVLKPSLVGGPQAALALATRAQAQGLRVVITTLIDSAIGRAMALHVAAALPEQPNALAHGLATGPLLADDLCEAESFDRGTLRVVNAAGLGITPEPARLARCATGDAIRFGTAA